MLDLQAHIEGARRLWRDRFSCGAPHCRGRRPWTRISEGTGSIRLHGQQFCFPGCFERELQRRLDELWIVRPRQSRPPHRIPLGLLMLSRGELTSDQLREALEMRQQDGSHRIGEHLCRLGFATEPQITAALGHQWSCPVLRALPTAGADCAIPLHLLRRFYMVPVHFNASTRIQHVAFATNIEYQALLAVEHMLDCKAQPCVADGSAVQGWLAAFELQRRNSDHLFEYICQTREITRFVCSYATKFCAVEARVTECGEYIWALVQGASEAANLLFRRTSYSE